MRGYTTALTGWVASIIAFDVMWCFTEMDVFGVFFLALCVGFIAAGAFLFLTDFLMEQRKPRRTRPTYGKDEATGIEYMPMRKGRGM